MRLSSCFLFLFQFQVPREISTPGPGIPSPPTQKYETSCPHPPTSTACPSLPAVGDGLVQSPAFTGLASHLVQAHRQQRFCLSRLQETRGLVGPYLPLWGLDKGSIPGGSCEEVSCFSPSLPALHALHDQGEDADPDRAVAAEMKPPLPYLWRNIWMESVCAWC